MAAAFCFAQNKIVVIDRAIIVEHPRFCGYSKKTAAAQKAEFMKQLSFIEAIHSRLLWSRITLNIYKNRPPVDMQ
jgi:outer membrane phospholipase A